MQGTPYRPSIRSREALGGHGGQSVLKSLPRDSTSNTNKTKFYPNGVVRARSNSRAQITKFAQFLTLFPGTRSQSSRFHFKPCCRLRPLETGLSQSASKASPILRSLSRQTSSSTSSSRVAWRPTSLVTPLAGLFTLYSAVDISRRCSAPSDVAARVQINTLSEEPIPPPTFNGGNTAHGGQLWQARQWVKA